ncbi:hypothetical protein BSPCLSOX_2288 [uncultured Gammaproteobacteria bacterium]|nr:hypothetical protein BSPCLSOX_2288 [uncultured Gammaproteobacteria bacterium]
MNNSLPLSSAKVTFVHNNIPVNKIDVFMVCIMLFVETFVRCLLLMENL